MTGTATTARDHILAAVRAAGAPAGTPPPTYVAPERDGDTVERFAAALESVAGRLVRCGDRRQVAAELELLTEAGSMLVGDGTPIPDGAIGPEAMADLETCVVSAQVGVAENAALWITTAGLPCRAAIAICRHLVVVVDAKAIVADMHQAYARVDIADGYGLFVSGPSKTADVEQCLVIGAHGATGLTCYLVGDA